MATKYTSQSAVGYNASPPPDDGSLTAANQVKWATIKTKLNDPLFNVVAAINSALLTSINEYNTYSNILPDTGGAANTYVTAYPTGMTGVYQAGLRIEFIAGHTNTGASTLNAGTQGAVNILKYGSTALVGGDIVAGQLTICEHDGTQFQLINPATAPTVEATSGPAASPFVFRNRLFNGDMRIAQRNTTFTNANQFTLDRWYTGRTGAVTNLNVSQVYGAFSSLLTCMKLQRTASDANVGSLNVIQPIEGINCRDMAGQTVTLSFLVGTGANINTTGHSVDISYQTTTTDIGVSSGSWTALTAQNFTVGASASFVASSFQFSIPSNATQLMVKISFAVVAGTAGADESFYLTNVQLERGAVVTPFEVLSYATELFLCQRFFETSYNKGVAVGSATTNNGSITGMAANQYDFYSFGRFRFCVKKRAAPTVTLYNPITGAAGYWRGITDSSDASTTSVTLIGDSGVGDTSCANGTMTAGRVYAAHFTAEAELT